MTQPIPASAIIAALKPLNLEKENARLRFQLAGERLYAAAELMFAKANLDGSEWDIDTDTGEMTKRQPPTTE